MRLVERLDVYGRVTALRRSVLDPRVLQGALPGRAAIARYRASRPEAAGRERRFAAASAAYAAAADDAGRFADRTRQVRVDGLAWSVPLTCPDDADAVARYVGKQDFPYRVIAQTREIALGGVMLDIGANNGRMSIPRVILGDVEAVYCAEPDPLNYHCLAANVRDNGLSGLVLPDRIAVAAEDGVARLARKKSAGGHMIVEPGVATRRETIDVACLTLDTWLERLGVDPRQVSFVKVDVQGSEVHVLRGAGRLLACPHVAWQVEIDPALLRTRGAGMDALLRLFETHFTHFVDLNRRARGPRVRPVAHLARGLGYLEAGPMARTDVLLCSLT